MEVPEHLLEEYVPEHPKSNTQLKKEVATVLESIQAAKRPIIIVGQGVRLAKALPEFYATIEKLRIPLLTSRLGIDLIESDNELYVGRPGTYGERSANFAIQNSDLIIAVGCRLATALVGHDPKNFGKNAKKIVVDIDQEELDKPGLVIDMKINNDAKLFFHELLKQTETVKTPDYKSWIEICNNWKIKYPVVQESYKDETPVNSYVFVDALTKQATKDDMVLVDTGTCFHVAAQAWKIKKDQRFLTTGGISSMGYWVAGLGACVANNNKRTIIITGDGSLQMNIQEFATIKHHNLPIKTFIFNNNGYLLIRHTQRNFMEGRLLGEGPDSGVWCPDSLKIAEAYGIKGVRINSVDELEAKIKEVMEYDGPVICDVMTPEWQLIMPRVSSDKMPDGSLVSRAYDDMFPHLDRDELAANTVK
jgi:acetolactate synthase-1/2/3 large subunit